MALKDFVSNVVDSAKKILHHYSEPKGDAIAILKADHREMEALFQMFLGETHSALRGQRENLTKVLAALTLHAKIEECILSPAVYERRLPSAGC